MIRLENGYILPKGTTIFPNLHRITRSSQYFEDPNTFNPERFLDENGKYAKIDQNVPFGVGKYSTSVNSENIRFFDK